MTVKGPANIRLLQPSDLPQLYEARYQVYTTIFSQYINWAAQDKDRFNQTIDTDLGISAGAFIDGQLACFVNMGSGHYMGGAAAYNSLTGTMPQYRRHNLAYQTFSFVLAHLQSLQYQRVLLEVLPQNQPALQLYQHLGFTDGRRLVSYALPATSAYKPSPPNTVYQCQNTDSTDWAMLAQWSQYAPAWQNRQQAVEQGYRDASCISIYHNGTQVGLAVYYPTTGTIVQLAVGPNVPTDAVAGILIDEIYRRALYKKLQAYHIDQANKPLTLALENKGFTCNATIIELTRKI